MIKLRKNGRNSESQHFTLVSASARKHIGFVVYFFAALIKHEICMKCGKCIASVSYFIVCFVKNTREMQNAKSV